MFLIQCYNSTAFWATLILATKLLYT